MRAARPHGLEFDWSQLMAIWREVWQANEPQGVEGMLDMWLEVPYGALFINGGSLHGRLVHLGMILRANAGPERGYTYIVDGARRTRYVRL